MKFKFSPKSDIIHIDANYISNGHWLVRKDALHFNKALEKTFKTFEYTPVGRYDFGVKTSDKPAELTRAIPKLSELTQAELNNEVVYNDDKTEIKAVVLQANNTRVRIATKYAALLQLGRVFVGGEVSPVLVVLPDDSVAAVIMPMRK